MTEYPPAIRQLISEVTALHPDAVVEPTGEVDGFDRTRSVHFDPDTAGWLEPIIAVIEDERIAEVKSNKKGLTITVVPDIRADVGFPFSIEEADAVLNED